MKRLTLFAAVLLAFTASGFADTIQFAIPDVQTGIIQPGYFDIYSSGLNGTVLNGQSLSLDLMIANDVLARVFMLDPDRFCVLLMVYTNAPSFPGFTGESTGFMLDDSGRQIGALQTAGRGDSSNGGVYMGLVSFTAADFNHESVVDLSGAHFDTSLPGTGYTIINAAMRFSFNGPSQMEFGTPAQLPESSSLSLLFIACGAILIAKRRICNEK